MHHKEVLQNIALSLSLIVGFTACTANQVQSTAGNKNGVEPEATWSLDNLTWGGTQTALAGSVGAVRGVVDPLCEDPEIGLSEHHAQDGMEGFVLKETCPNETEANTRFWSLAQDQDGKTIAVLTTQTPEDSSADGPENTNDHPNPGPEIQGFEIVNGTAQPLTGNGITCEDCLDFLKGIVVGLATGLGGSASMGCMGLAMKAGLITAGTGFGSLLVFVLVGLVCGFMGSLTAEAIQAWEDPTFSNDWRRETCTDFGFCEDTGIDIDEAVRQAIEGARNDTTQTRP